MLLLLGGPPRVGKSLLAERIVRSYGIPWLPLDVVRSLLRRVLPDLDQIDRGCPPMDRVAEAMWPHVRKAAELCLDHSDTFLIEGAEIFPNYAPRLVAEGLGPVHSVFLVHSAFTARELERYSGRNPWHQKYSAAEVARWIAEWSLRLGEGATRRQQTVIDLASRPFDEAMDEATAAVLAGLRAPRR